MVVQTVKRGTDFGWDSDEGITFMAQYDWTPTIYDRPAQLYVGVAHAEVDYTKFSGGDASSSTNCDSGRDASSRCSNSKGCSNSIE